MSGSGVIGSSDQVVGSSLPEVENRSGEPSAYTMPVQHGPASAARVDAQNQPQGTGPTITDELADRVRQAVQPGQESEAWSHATGPSHQQTNTFPLSGRQAYGFNVEAKRNHGPDA
jgi:hypothetical protein